MTAHAAEFFTLDEVNRLKIIQDVVDRRLTTQMAAQRLGISDRQCRRLLSRYRESGPLGMANRRRGKPSNNHLPDGLARYALSIIRERYTDFGPTLACEKLAELHDVYLSKETVRSLMVKAGLWVPRKQRAPKIQQPRYRRACCGELIQIDGCDHHWFENRAPACTVLVYVDDATSRLMQLRFVKSESTFTYFEATRGYLEKHGKPLALYSDKASVFRINNKNATGGDGFTQFGRAMHELNIQTICANTSSAKGRVERAHLTLQDRLVKELRLRGISSVDAANEYADEFMDDYNRRFAKAPRHDFDVHRPLEHNDDLAAFFTWREPRRVSKSLTVQYDKVLYLIEDSEI
ncbi:TPA: ISNCY family transposase, partial [Klebsiella pneumoniae]|nr:ISNCY family transposase [Klebsiella pneumoniae]